MKKLHIVVNELFIRGWKLYIFFGVHQTLAANFFIMKIPNKQKFQQIGITQGNVI